MTIVLASDYVGSRIVEFLTTEGYRLTGVVLDASDRGGFNAEIRRLAKASSVDVFDSGQLGHDAFLRRVRSASPEIGILAWWPHLLRDPVLSLPSRGWLNCHPSLLPLNRGKHPNFWCIADSTPCGVTLHWVDAGVDSGAIVAQARIDTVWQDTGESVYLRCRERIIELFREPRIWRSQRRSTSTHLLRLDAC
jgi:methionyl-tRNA formyltransferase